MKNRKWRIDIESLFGILGTALGVIIGLFWIFTILYPRIKGNKTFVDLKHTYTKAITSINGEKLEIDIDTWNDYDGEQIQIIGKDGKTYLVSSFNTILIGE